MANNVLGRERGVMLDRVNPDSLRLIDDPKHPLCQKRRLARPKDWMIASVRDHGVKVPILVRKGPTIRGQVVYEVVDGRQRVLCARIVNEERIKAGKMPLTLVCEVFTGTDEEAAALVEILNLHRLDEDPITRAEGIARQLHFGASKVQVLNENPGWTMADLERHLALLEVVPEVQAAVVEGKLQLAAVPALRKLEREEQVEQVQKLAAEGKSGPREVGRAVDVAKPEVRRPQMRRRPKIEEKLAELRTSTTATSLTRAKIAALQWVLAEVEDL